MNFKVYLLAMVSFVVGLVELIIGGILDQIAETLHVSISTAGQLITIFSVVFAISAPILIALTAKFERKLLCITTLMVFLFGNIIAFLSPNFTFLMISRVISAASGSLLVVLCTTIAANIVSEQYRARAIGIIYMGISGSLVLGVPVGLVISSHFGWRMIFLFIAILTLFSMIAISMRLHKIAPKPQVSILKQLKTLKNAKILSAQVTSMLFLTGHLTLYAYLTPFLKTTLHLNPTWISIYYFIFGISAVFGGGVGGFASDKWGAKRSILTMIPLFTIALFLLPKLTFSTTLFVIVMMVWSMLSWAITPAQQSYLIESAPKSADIQQGLNNTALHLGIALGSSIGGIVIHEYSVLANASVGSIFTLLAFLCAIFSITRTTSTQNYQTNHILEVK